MAEKLIFSAEEARFLKELVKNKVEFMVVGLSAAALQGAPVVTQDVDLWFRDLTDSGIQKALQKVGGTYIPPWGQNPPMFSGGKLKLLDIVLNMHGLGSFNQEVKHTHTIPLQGVALKVLTLERIIKSKKAINRKKDQLTIPVLEDALAAVKKVAKS